MIEGLPKMSKLEEKNLKKVRRMLGLPSMDTRPGSIKFYNYSKEYDMFCEE